jgi:hypothetical protein
MRESHYAVAKEAKRAMHIDYKNLPRAPGRFLKLKLEKMRIQATSSSITQQIINHIQ